MMAFRNSILFGIIISLLLLTCDSGEENYSQQDLVGQWYFETAMNDQAYIYRVEYSFNEDGTLEIIGKVFDTRSGEFVGYRHRATAKYALNQNSLVLSEIERFSNHDEVGLYGSFDDLAPVTSAAEETMTISLNGYKNILTFHFTCGPLGNCIESQTLYRN
jgi:hypothetical protein